MNLTDEQKTALNVGLNEWAGWTDIREQDYCEAHVNPYEGPVLQFWQGVNPETEEKEPLPNYCSDLNAINRLEERLTDEKFEIYRWTLWGDCKASDVQKWHRNYLSASAEQRAIAMARTLNLNIEGVTE